MEPNKPTRPVWTIAPGNFRDNIQDQINNTVRVSLGAYSNFSIGDIDGRFILSEPMKIGSLVNEEGYHYHMVGENVMGDNSVAAP